MAVVSSVPLLLIFCLLGMGVLVSYYQALKDCTEHEREALFAGVEGGWRIPFCILPPVCAIAFTYSTIFIEGLPDDTTVLGMGWRDGGEAVVCSLYTVVIGLSCFWMPLAVKSIREPSNAALALWVVLVLNGVGLAACGLAACALTTNAPGLDTSGVRYKLHVAAAVVFAFQTEITDGVIWSILFRRMLHKMSSGQESLKANLAQTRVAPGSDNITIIEASMTA